MISGALLTVALLTTAPWTMAATPATDDTPLAELGREQRSRVYNYALTVCLASLEQAHALTRDIDGSDAFELGFFFDGDELARHRAELPAVLPDAFVSGLQQHAVMQGRQFWRQRLDNSLAAFALPEACREYSRALYKTRKAYRLFDRQGRFPEITPISDDELLEVARQRESALGELRRPAPRLAGAWGEVPGCQTGRVYTFGFARLRMDPRAGVAGGPPEYLPMQLAIDEFRPRDPDIVAFTDSGESFRIAFDDPRTIELRAERVAVGSICSTFVGGGRLHRCPP